MLSISGLIAIPSDPQVQTIQSHQGYFINFRATSQGRAGQDGPSYHYWNCSVWVTEEQKNKWLEEYIKPGNVLYIEYGQVHSTPTQDGKYQFVKVKLEHNKTRKLSVPLWYKEEDK